MSISHNIKEIIFKFINNEYQNYLKNHNILLIKNENMTTIINNFYEENKNNLKTIIRRDLKELYNIRYFSR
jgi:hypothetical protein